MTQLTHWIPERWREALVSLRDDIYAIAERWFPWHHGHDATRNGHVPVRYGEPMDAAQTFGTPSRFLASSPVIDIDETDDEVVVTAELPGLQPDDFVVEITAKRLVIRGEKKHESRRTDHGYTYRERHYGAFAQALTLPCEVDVDKAEANYQHGVLRMTVPKTERAKARRVRIPVQG